MGGGGDGVAGHWGQWSEWVCHYQCYIHTEKRVRFCDDPAPANDGAECVGNSEDFKNSTCGQNLVCPLECPVGLWDFNCDKTCLTCSPDCDKFSGSCESCVAGYKFPESGCDTECGVNTFGPNCEGDCLQKCETDCVDRVEGTCPIVSNNMKYLLLIFLVVPVVGVILLLLRKKKELIVEEALVPFE
ncbi:semaphorin-5B-like [Physella acuta]|uniref:semaphorin-5B-like n=1 Tax=Physella acuta TaxID=109671 RepID=UPI0027DAE13F|nr:semaphorin-5B-like [Physella acuta]